MVEKERNKNIKPRFWNQNWFYVPLYQLYVFALPSLNLPDHSDVDYKMSIVIPIFLKGLLKGYANVIIITCGTLGFPNPLHPH